MRKIILASSSPRRKKIFKEIGLDYKVITNNINEDLLIKYFQKEGFTNLVKILSLAKAISAIGGRKGTTLHGNEIVAAFDTIVVCKNKIIGKPKNKRDAIKKLLFLSNKKHNVITGIAILDLKTKKIFLDHETTKVWMKKITKYDALNYVNTKEPLDKAGAYAIQGKGKKFVKRIHGDYLNVVGLPQKRFLSILFRVNPI